MIDQLTIDRIYSVAKIEEVVGEYVSLRRYGANLKGLCPFHDEKTPSFSVSPSKGIYKCFGCGKGGNAVNFVMEIEHVSYYEALKLLAKKYGIEIVEKELSPEQLAEKNIREAMFAINEFAGEYFAKTLKESVEGRSVGLSYFRERGISDSSIAEFSLGFCLSDMHSFTDAALKKGFRKEMLLKTGLTKESARGLYDFFHGRVMYPVHSISGRIVAFGGRILQQKSKEVGKYFNSPESEIYHKSDQLYGIYQAKNDIVKQNLCYLVEGYMDVISMHQAGVRNVVASSGTSLTTGQIRVIHRFTSNVTVLYDGDAAGIHASLRGIDMLLEEGLSIKVVSLPDGEDPDSYAQTHNADETVKYLEDNSVDFIRFKTDLLLQDAGNDPMKRSRLIVDIVRSIAVIPDAITRSVYTQECSRMMGIEEQVLSNEIGSIRRGKAVRDVGIQLRNEKETERHQQVLQQSSVTNAQSPSANVVSKKYDDVYYRLEAELIRYLIKFGAIDLYCDNNGQWKTVAQFAAEELAYDNIVIQNPIIDKLFKAIVSYCDSSENHVPLDNVYTSDSSLTPEQRTEFYAKAEQLQMRLSQTLFLSPNPEVSSGATRFGIDRYTLSSKQKEMYGHDYRRMKNILIEQINSIRLKMVMAEINKVNEDIRSDADEEQRQKQLKRLMVLNQVKRKLSGNNRIKM